MMQFEVSVTLGILVSACRRCQRRRRSNAERIVFPAPAVAAEGLTENCRWDTIQVRF
jgi:hypothetical protein